MKVEKQYITGATIYQGDSSWQKFVAFQDCDKCNGKGYQESQKYGYSYRTKKNQCVDCAIRHGSPRFFNAHSVYKDIEREAKKVMPCAQSEKLTGTEKFNKVESFNIDHPLAIQYRQLLKSVWGWKEPESI